MEGPPSGLLTEERLEEEEEKIQTKTTPIRFEPMRWRGGIERVYDGSTSNLKPLAEGFVMEGIARFFISTKKKGGSEFVHETLTAFPEKDPPPKTFSFQINFKYLPPVESIREEGTPRPLNVFLHDISLNSFEWLEFSDLIRERIGASVLIDAVGMGKTNEPKGWTFDVQNDSIVLFNFLDWLGGIRKGLDPMVSADWKNRISSDGFGTRRVVIYGSGSGANVALKFADTYPEKCTFLHLVNPLILGLDLAPNLRNLETYYPFLYNSYNKEDFQERMRAKEELMKFWMRFPDMLWGNLTDMMNTNPDDAVADFSFPYQMARYGGGGSISMEVLRDEGDGRPPMMWGTTWKPDPYMLDSSSNTYRADMTEKFQKFESLVRAVTFSEVSSTRINESFNYVKCPVSIAWGDQVIHFSPSLLTKHSVVLRVFLGGKPTRSRTSERAIF